MTKSLVEKYEQVLSQDPASTVFVELAKALLERGEPDRAIEVCQNGLSHHPTSVVGRVLWGKALINKGKPAEAMNQFDLAVNIDKDNPHAYNLIGEALLQKGLYRSALPILRKAVALQPNDGRVRQWLEQTRIAMTGGPAPVLTPIEGPPEPLGEDPAATVALKSVSAAATAKTPAESEGGVITAPANTIPAGHADDDSLPTVVTQAYSPGQGGPPVLTAAPGDGRSSPTVELPTVAGASPNAAVTLDDPFAAVPKRTDSNDTIRGLTSTFDQLQGESEAAGSMVPIAGPGAMRGQTPQARGGPPVLQPVGASAPFDGPSEPTVVPSADLLGEAKREAKRQALLDDVPSATYPGAVPPPPPSVPEAPPRFSPPPAKSGGLLDDIPDHVESALHPIEAPRHHDAHPGATEAIAREYERELREKLAVASAKKTFLQKHGLKLALALAALVAVGGGAGAYFYTRSANQGLDLASALARGRSALNADTRAQYQQAISVLSLARKMDGENLEARALEGYAHAVLYGEHGRAGVDQQAAIEALSTPGVKETFPELALVMSLELAEGEQKKVAQQAIVSSTVDKSEVHAEAGRILLADGKTNEALQQLTKAVELFPGNVRALVTLGEYYLSFEDFENAAKMFGGQAAQLSPSHPGRVLGLAEARLQLGRDIADSVAQVEALTPEAGLPPSLVGRRELVYGRLLSADGKHEQAIKVLAAADKVAADRPYELNFSQGVAYRAAGQMDSAQRAFEAAVKSAPKGKSADAAKEGLGRVLIARGRERELLEKLPRDDSSRKVSLVRGVAYARLGDWKKARTELARTQVSNKYPPEAVVYLSLADASEENSDKAVETLKRLVDTTKRNKAVAQVALGRLHMQRGELDKAKAVLEEAAKDPGDYEANALLGELLSSLGLPEVAYDFLARAVERNASHGPARHLLVRITLDQGRLADALKIAEGSVADNPSSAVGHKDLALALLWSGRSKDAEGAINKALKLDGADAEANRIRAQVSFARADPKNGFSSLEKANKLDPKDAVTFCEIGNAMVRQGNLDIAPKAYEAARREDPKAICGEIGPYHARPVASKNAVRELTEASKKATHLWDKALALAALARVKLLQGDVKGAKSIAEEATTLAPFNGPAWYAAGLIALKGKDEQGALAALGKAVEYEPSWGAARLALADIFQRQGKELWPRAVSEYEAVLAVSQNESDVGRAKNELKQLKKKL